MASSKSTTMPAVLSLLFLLAMFICSEAKIELGELQETTMKVYFQDYAFGPNATLIPVTGIDANGEWAFNKFGTMFCTDDPITESIEVDSAEVARAQGIYITSSLDGTNTHVLISILFTNEEHKGSSLEVQGSSTQLEKLRELSVVSGTGKFRFARGFAIFTTLHVDFVTGYSVIECNITVLHY